MAEMGEGGRGLVDFLNGTGEIRGCFRTAVRIFILTFFLPWSGKGEN